MDTENESTFELFSEISPSQEQIFQTCSFTREQDYFSCDVDEESVGEYELMVPMSETPMNSTGIIMVSLRTTPIAETISQQDQFQTPPEGPNLNDGDCSVNGEEMYKDCDLGFSQSQTGSENFEINLRVPGVVESGSNTLSVDEKVVLLELGGETLSVDADCLEGKKIVDLDNDKLIVDLDNDKLISDLDSELIVGMDNIYDLGGETLSDNCLAGEEMFDLNSDCEPIADLVDSCETLADEDDLLQGEKLVDLDTDCNLGQTKDPITDLADGDQTLSIDDHCLEGEKMVDLDKDTEDQLLSKDQIVATTIVANDSDCEKVVHLDKDTEDQALSDIQIVEQSTTAVDRDTDETAALPDCEKTVDLGKDSCPGSSIGKLPVRMSAMELEEIDAEKNVESQELEKEGIIGIVVNSLSQGVDLISDNILTETVEPELQEITGEKKVKLQESSNGKDDATESEKNIVRIVEDPPSEGDKLVSDNGPAEAIESDNLVSDNASSSGVNRDKRKKNKKKKTSEISTDLPKRGRELPASILGGVNNVKEAETPTDFLMNLLKSLAKKPAPKKDDDNGDNMVITAMKRGVTFPRPRSWPPGYRPSWFPEGYDCVD